MSFDALLHNASIMTFSGIVLRAKTSLRKGGGGVQGARGGHVSEQLTRWRLEYRAAAAWTH